jgi:hypothetical protein
VGADGLPLSWWHFVLGSRAGQRYGAKEMLEMYEPTLMAQADKESRREWEEGVKIHAGLK